MTRGVEQWVSADEMLIAILRHSKGDWGNLSDSDKRENDEALKSGSRLLSAYQTSEHRRFWIITEHDRSHTTILLPIEY